VRIARCQREPHGQAVGIDHDMNLWSVRRATGPRIVSCPARCTRRADARGLSTYRSFARLRHVWGPRIHNPAPNARPSPAHEARPRNSAPAFHWRPPSGAHRDRLS
jgi:hypothetical protein